MDNFNEVSEELVAAWLDGNLSPIEDQEFMDLLSSDQQLADIMNVYDDIESSFENIIEDGWQVPDKLNSDFELPSISTVYFEDSSDSFFDTPTINNSEEEQNRGDDTNENYEEADISDNDEYLFGDHSSEFLIF